MKPIFAARATALPLILIFLSPLLGAQPDDPNPNCLPDSVCPEWTTRYDSASHLYDHAFDLVVSPDGNRVYVTGASTSTTGGLDFLTIAYDAANGQQVWQTRYDSANHGADAPAGSSALGNAIAISADGAKIFVTGYSADSNGKNGYLTIAYNAVDGAEVWTARYETPLESQATATALSGDGQRLYVTGYSALAPNPSINVPNYDFATVAYNTLTGGQLWVTRYEGPAAFWDIPYSIRVASVQQPDHSRREQAFVAGRSNGASTANTDTDFATVAYDGLSGAELWIARYDGPGHDRDLAYALGATPDGSAVFVTGESVGNGTNTDYATVSYDAVTGAQRWVMRYEQSDLDLPLALAVNASGNRVAVTGFSVNPGALTVIDRSAATIVYDTATGAQIWVARHGEVDGAAASRVAFSRDDRRLYIAGLENGNVIGVGAGGVGGQVGHAPALTVAYDAASGSEAWAVHYSGPSGDEGNSGLALSPDGAHVFVSGGGQSQGADFATLSYAGLPPLPPIQLSSVVSRKTYGNGKGTFDIDLPLTGAPGIECRAVRDTSVGSVDYKLIFSFPDALSSVGSVSASATGTSQPGPSSGSIDPDDAHRYIANLSALPEAQYVTVTLTNAADAVNHGGNVSVTFGLLVGDVNASGRVDSGDVFLVRQQSLQDANASNFRDDINSSGRIDSGDVFLARQQSLNALP